MIIKNIRVRQARDSRAKPTIRIDLRTNKGVFSAFAPSGASKGKYEAIELRDQDGKGVKKAIKRIKEVVFPCLKNKSFSNQKEVDELLIKIDGTENKSFLGANSILAVSLAVCRANAAERKLELFQYIKELMARNEDFFLPFPCFNIINGGAHAQNSLDIQEFIIIPQEEVYSKNLKAGIDIYNSLKKNLKKAFPKQRIKKGDEGGFSPLLFETSQALDFLKKSIEYHPKTKMGLDCASTQFFKDGFYFLEKEKKRGEELLKFYKELINKYPIIYLEDPFAEEDWQNWRNLKEKISNVVVIGDDLTVTNIKRIKKAVEERAVSGVIIKPNQIGTIKETIEAVQLAKENNLKVVVSHRSGETKDDFIADLAVGVGAEFIKAGAPGPKERMAKYKRLLKIERIINSR